MNLKYFVKVYFNVLIKNIIFFCVLSNSSVVSAQTDSDELIQLLNNIHTMQATFKQHLVDKKDIKRGEETIGSMILMRPGKFRWEIVKPNKQLIIVNKNKLLLYDADLAQVTKRKMDYKKQGNPAMLLSSSSDELKHIFNIIKLKISNKEEIWFELKPKQKNNTYQWIKIHFSRGKLNAMYIFDNFEQKTEISFSGIVVNSKISQDKFEFIVPPKVDVIDER